MQQKLDILLDDITTKPDERFSSLQGISIHDDEVEVAFLREKQLRGAS
jgi:hypothetical protein